MSRNDVVSEIDNAVNRFVASIMATMEFLEVSNEQRDYVRYQVRDQVELLKRRLYDGLSK